MPPRLTTEKKRPTKDRRCGAQAGYSAHRRRGERPCAACRKANAAAERERLARKKAAAAEQPTAPQTNATIAAATAPPVVLPTASAPPSGDGPAPQPPRYLRERGRALWEAVTGAHALTPGALVLLGEACRTVDRLERMAAALANRETLWFELGDVEAAEDAGVPIVVNGMIGEARQLQNQLRQTLGQLGVVGVESTEREEAPSVLDQLAARRAARLAGGDG